MKKIPNETLAWVGAVLDIKGSIVRKHNKNRATPQIVLMVESKNFDVIRRLGSLTGSVAELQKQRTAKEFMRRGCAAHCPEAHVHYEDNWKMPPIARWTITGAGAGIVLHNVLPYMVSDRGFTESKQETLRNSVVSGQGSGATKVMIKRLIELGWKLPPEIKVTGEELALIPTPEDPFLRLISASQIRITEKHLDRLLTRARRYA